MSVFFNKRRLAQSKLFGVLLVACFVGGAGCFDDGSFDYDVGEGSEEIIGGATTTSYPAIGSIPVGCTGTLVHPHVFVTASHCCGGSDGCGRTVTVNGVTSPVVSSNVHPDYYKRADGSINPSADIAVMVLAEPLTHVTPYPLAGTGPYLGRPITLVGYGCNTLDYGDGYGTKRHGLNTIGYIGSDVGGGDRTRFRHTFGADSNATFARARTCPGDSGGPILWDEGGSKVLAGISHPHRR